MVTDVELVPAQIAAQKPKNGLPSEWPMTSRSGTPKSPDSAGLTAGCKDGICQQSSGGQARSI